MDNYKLTTEDDNSTHSLSDFDDIAEGGRLMHVYANDMIVKYLLRPMALHLVEYVHRVRTTVVLNANRLSKQDDPGDFHCLKRIPLAVWLRQLG